ncbi:hypothetical protein [Pseudomonas sp. TH31]|uniref:hypothetical protein n=1 Tax=Pseudomonas sp. TH31 TaxID=2796396 RepID=UPI001914D93B|nr:hypothetical protein [Pseudomonas sp. TH31]MBK5415738.1 hypothetical protein [Pseudomonas sp. TH31]
MDIPLFIILRSDPDALSAVNQLFDAKKAKLLEAQAKINNLLNTASIGCPGTAKTKELTRLSEEVEGEIKKNQEMQANQNQKIEGVVARA